MTRSLRVSEVPVARVLMKDIKDWIFGELGVVGRRTTGEERRGRGVEEEELPQRGSMVG